MLYNPKECGERKKVCPFFLLENSRPLSPWGPLDSLLTCLGNDSLIGFPDSSVGKESAYNAGEPVQLLGQEDPLEKGQATHYSIPGLPLCLSW